ncbi:MAG: HAMP domain-containing sensor histidine kinase, partial [Halobacteria archaeon]|nr:HAMP domain-containing sensor histidine kinase [Halobacteria archaeon]
VGADLEVEEDVSLRADRGSLLQMFENLFRNSVEHGSTSNSTGSNDSVEHGGDKITVTVGELENYEGFYVEDDGKGIPKDRQNQVLEQGYTTSDEGTGLGLSIVREIADAHGWDIEVGKSEKGGARFEVRTK